MKLLKLDHLVLVTSHLEECIKFYKTLGFQVQDLKGRYELTSGELKINVYVKGREYAYPFVANPTPGSLELSFELDNGLDQLKDYLEKQGLAVEGGITPHRGARGAMRSFYLRDPDGNLVEVIGYDV